MSTGPTPRGSEKTICQTCNLDMRRTPTPDDTVVMDAGATVIHLFPTEPTFGSRYRVGPHGVVFGRHTIADVLSSDPSVSAIHATLEARADGSYRVTDLGSRNGTFLNNVRVDAGTVRHGDYVRLGDSVYRFLSRGDIEAGCRAELALLAAADPLTGLPGRDAFTAALEVEVASAIERGRPVSVIVVDVDHLQSVNDRYGRPTGDEVVRAVGIRVRDLVRVRDLLVRYAGQLFALLLPGIGGGTAARVADRLRAGVVERPLRADGREVAVGVTTGVASLEVGEVRAPCELFIRAEVRLERAKRNRAGAAIAGSRPQFLGSRAGVDGPAPGR